jgi:hypothetical protein
VVRRLCLAAVAVFVLLAAPARADVFDDNPSAATLNGKVYVFARAADDRIIERVLDNGVWGSWAPVDGLSAGSGPAALAFGTSLYLFARGQNGEVWWNVLLPTGNWFGWRSLGGQVTSAPGAGLRYGTTTIDLAARGTNNELYHRSLVTGQDWTAWESLGGNIGSAPTVVGFSTLGSIDIFVRDTVGQVAQRYWLDGAWHDWGSAGGTAVGAPTSTFAHPDRLDIYVRGGDSGLYYHEHRTAGTVWSQVDPTPLSSSPAATSDAPGHELIFARIGADLHVKAATIPANGAPSFGAWSSLGPIALPAGAPAPPLPAPAPAPQPQPAAPLVTLAPTLSYFGSYSRRTSRFSALNVTAVPAGATVRATCPKGCSAKTYTVTKKKAGTVSLKRFTRRALKVGTKLTVVTTKPGTIGSHKVLTIRARKRPSITSRCLPPGVTRPQAC